MPYGDKLAVLAIDLDEGARDEERRCDGFKGHEDLTVVLVLVGRGEVTVFGSIWVGRDAPNVGKRQAAPRKRNNAFGGAGGDLVGYESGDRCINYKHIPIQWFHRRSIMTTLPLSPVSLDHIASPVEMGSSSMKEKMPPM